MYFLLFSVRLWFGRRSVPDHFGIFVDSFVSFADWINTENCINWSTKIYLYIDAYKYTYMYVIYSFWVWTHTRDGDGGGSTAAIAKKLECCHLRIYWNFLFFHSIRFLHHFFFHYYLTFLPHLGSDCVRNSRNISELCVDVRFRTDFMRHLLLSNKLNCNSRVSKRFRVA